MSSTGKQSKSSTGKRSKEPKLVKGRGFDSESEYDVSDTGSHMEDSDYERDGFVVDDEEYTSSGDDREHGVHDDEDDDEAFLRENRDKLVVEDGHKVGGRVLRTRRKPKTLQEIYDELCQDVEDHESELAEIVDELGVFKGRRNLTASERKEKADLQKDKTFVEERLRLLRQKVEDMEEDHKVYHGDIDGLEEKRASLESRLHALENDMAEAERSNNSKAYSKANKNHKNLLNNLKQVETQIADYYEEQAVTKGEVDSEVESDSHDDDSDVSMSDASSYDSDPSADSEDDDSYSDESDYGDED